MLAGGGEFRGRRAEPAGRAALGHAPDSAARLAHSARSPRLIAPNFEYSTPKDLKEALALLADPGAKALAGGMSLIPLMKLRLAAPELLVDLARIPGLNGIREEAGRLQLGALCTHFEVESSPVVRGRCPLLAATASQIGDVQVRNVGTLGGGVVHCDPAADYPDALQAL